MLFKIASLNSLLVLVRLFYGFIASKVTAVYLGPQGLALLGNFRDFSQIVYNFSAKNFESGIIKNIAEEDLGSRRKVVTIIKLTALVSLIVSIILFFGSSFFSQLLFKDLSYSWIFKLFCFLLPLISLNLVLLSVINGKGQHKLLVTIQVIGFAINAILLTLLIIEFGLKGALTATVLFLALQLLITLFYLKQSIKSYFRALISNAFDRKLITQLLSYFLMAFFSISLTFIVNFLIRNKLIDSLGIIYGGYWEAINRISSFSLMFFSSMLIFYLLPKLTSLIRVGEYRSVMKEYFVLILPLLSVVLILIYFLRDFVVRILLTKEFMSIGAIIQWQLLGDFIRVLAVSLAYLFHAKRRLFAYYISDTIYYVSYLLLGISLIFSFGVKGVLYGYLISNILYLISIFFFLKNELFNKNLDAIIKNN